jgi:hypothetical protein
MSTEGFDRCGRRRTDVGFFTHGDEPSTAVDIICDDCAPTAFRATEH